MERIARSIDCITNKIGYIAGIMMCLSVCLVIAEIVARSIFNATIYISSEYSAYLMVGMTFLGFSYALKEKEHIRMAFLHKFITKGKPRLFLDLYTFLVGLLLFIVITYISFDFFLNSLQSGARSMQLTRTYLAIPQFAMVIGSFFVVIQFFSEIIKRIKEYQKEKLEKNILNTGNE